MQLSKSFCVLQKKNVSSELCCCKPVAPTSTRHSLDRIQQKQEQKLDGGNTDYIIGVKKHHLQIPLQALGAQLQVCWELASAAKHLGVSCQTPCCQLPLSKSLKTEVWAFSIVLLIAGSGCKMHLL